MNITFTGLTGTINQALWDALPEGNIPIKFYANDTLGRIESQEILVTKDVTAPTITIQSPIGDEVFGINAPNFLIEIIEPYLDTMWYTVDGGITNITFTENGTISQSAWDALAEGNVDIRFYANDTLGRIGYSEVTIKKDVTTPIITINDPQNNELIGVTAPNFNISIDEPNLDDVWYSLNGGMNITFTGLTGIINLTLWDMLPEGNVVIKFYAVNTLGKIGYSEVVVNKDTTPPVITIISPEEGDIFENNPPAYSIDVNDANLDTIWYSLDNGATCITISELRGVIDEVEWNEQLNGFITIRFYANDTLGEIGFQEITVTKAIPQPIPPEIPGYDLVFLVGIISVMVVIIIKKKINHLN